VELVGLLGGVRWEWTEYCHRQLDRGVRDRLGGHHSARCLLFPVDLADAERMHSAGACKIEPVIPPADHRAVVHRVISDELCLGELLESAAAYWAVLARPAQEGAEAVVPVRTEIGLVGPEDSPIPIFGTTSIHVETTLDRDLDEHT
jgi:aspartate/glutamate racemase